MHIDDSSVCHMTGRLPTFIVTTIRDSAAHLISVARVKSRYPPYCIVNHDMVHNAPVLKIDPGTVSHLCSRFGPVRLKRYRGSQ